MPHGDQIEKVVVKIVVNLISFLLTLAISYNIYVQEEEREGGKGHLYVICTDFSSWKLKFGDRYPSN